MAIRDRINQIKHAWNVFMNLTDHQRISYGGGTYGSRPDRTRMRFQNERSIISSIYTRLGIDVAAIDIRHVRLDDQGRYADDINSGLQNCLLVEANLDQGC